MSKAVLEFTELPEEKLGEIVRERLSGKTSVFSVINEMRGEHPADILISIYEFEGGVDFKNFFRIALMNLLKEIPGHLVNTETKYFRRLISLIGRLEILESMEFLMILFLESKKIDESSFNHKAILSVLESFKKFGI